MISRVIDSKLPLIVYNPAGVVCPDYFQSVHEAGGLPVLDTDFLGAEASIAQIKELEKRSIIFGVRIKLTDTALIEFINTTKIANLTTVVLAYDDICEIDPSLVTSKEYKLIIEVIDIAIDEPIKPFMPSAIIVKGNEAPGRVSKYTSFVLLQWYKENTDLPVIVHGGVGQYTGAGMLAAGASGLVLDEQLYLTDESPIASNFKKEIEKLEEKDSVLVGQSLGRQYRFFSKLGTKIVKELKEKESLMMEDEDADAKLYEEIKKNIAHVDDESSSVVQSLFYLGPDAIFAKNFVREHSKLKEIFYTLFKTFGEILKYVDKYDPMVEDSPLAKDHGTSYPIIQGPMANISDKGDFAAEVYKHGGLPFMAMGSLPPKLAEDLLLDAKGKADVYGAGMIGISSLNKTIDDHMNLIKEHKVPFALFAGGQPGQVKELEAAGTKAYLHTPAASMLENAVNNGVTRCIFEGREAGGHVGSLTSMVLWESSIQRMVNKFSDKLDGKTMIFAGGIGSKTGSHFISGMTSFLAAKGTKVGIQVGTSYLFAKEIVEAGAIKPLYQQLMKDMTETIVMGETLGLSTRSLVTPFSKGRICGEHKRIKDGIPLQERKHAFEKENLGSLLIGAKAFSISFPDGKAQLNPIAEDDALERGNFMSGDSLVFTNVQTTVETIHKEFITKKYDLFKNLDMLEVFSSSTNEVNDEVAVVGLGAIFPESTGYEEFWQSILDKKYFIKEVDPKRLDHSLYYDADRKAPDKTYAKIAATIDHFVFDHEKYGYDEEEARLMSRTQKMILEAAHLAVADAGYLDGDKELPKKKTSVIIGTCLGNEIAHSLVLKYYMPEVKHHLEQLDEYKALSDEEKAKVVENLKAKMSYGLMEEIPDQAALNIEAVRVASHLGLEGTSFVVDAACATSFAALDSGIKELLSGNQDAVICGGINTNMMPEPFVGFSKMGALSADGSWPFDERSNGFVMGEGVGIFVLKRLKDAIRDGDRIHSVIRGLGGSSDGKGKFIAAPSADGQEFALRRCYDKMKRPMSPDEVGFIEAHGTSTQAGDKTEIETIKRVYKGSSPIGISSVKSQIGHLLGGAGAAGLVKAILACERKILPPNGGFNKLSPRCPLEGSPLFVVKDQQPWNVEGNTRKAAVSSYGFGGINYHCVVEEFNENFEPLERKIFTDPDYDYNEDRVVIVGAGVLAPGAKNMDEFWKVLESGENQLVDLPGEKFHIETYADESGDFYLPKSKVGMVQNYKFNNVKFRIPPSSASHIDRGQLFALDIAGQALESSGLKDHLDKGNNIAVLLGTMSGEMNSENIMRTRVPFVNKIVAESGVKGADAIADKLTESLNKRYVTTTEDTIPGLLSNILSGRICNFYGCNGANYTIDASCASAAVAIDFAAKGIRDEDYEFALTGGIDTNILPTTMKVFHELGILAEKETAFFDSKSHGVNFGEGGAIFALAKYKTAKKYNMPVMAELNALNFKIKPTDDMYTPSSQVFADTIEETYVKGNASKRTVQHLDVFGTANILLDQVEHQSISKAFKGHQMSFGNVKPEIGYMRSANPAIAMAKMLLMEKERKLLPARSFEQSTSIVKMGSPLKAVSELSELSSARNTYAANVFGHGGTHGHIVMSTFPEWIDSASAALPVREAASSAPVSLSQSPMAAAAATSVALLCSGQGAQRNGMMKELYGAYPAVKATIDKADALFKSMRGYSIKELMFNDPEGKLNSTENTQVSIFISSAAVFELLKENGFSADYYLGHSLGEFSALYCAGAIGFEDALRLVIKRSEFMLEAANSQKGAIMVVMVDAATAESHLKASGIANIWVANKNSNGQTAVSGEDASVDKFCEYLKEKKVSYKKLNLSGAFHTPMFKSAADKLASELASVSINAALASKVVANVTASPYPADEAQIKATLTKQMISPVEWVKSIEFIAKAGMKHTVEAGPGRLLTNLLRKIDAEFTNTIAMVDPKKGEAESCKAALAEVKSFAHLPVAAESECKPVMSATSAAQGYAAAATPVQTSYQFKGGDTGFESFLKQNDDKIKELLYQEYLKARKEEAFAAVEKRGIYTGRVVIPGVSVGLPGLANKVFSDDNFDKLLRGVNLIDKLSDEKQADILDKNITRLFKETNGNARYVEISSTDDIMHLAGQLGYFDLQAEYGFKYNYDVTFSLAIAAGIEALKDANIPLIMNHKQTTTGSTLPDRIMLPKDMQNSTGVIFTSLFAGFETLINEITEYHYEKFVRSPYKKIEDLYYYIMEKSDNREVKEKVTDWYFEQKKQIKEGHYEFDRNLLVQILSLGSGHFAQFIGAKGPNARIDSQCASTTQAVAVAEDWIRMGRCERVIIIGGESATSEAQNQWIGSGFLALGAATVKQTVEEAAKPFDETRNGMIVGSAAVGMVVERADTVEKRGLVGQAEVLGTYTGNSAFHVSKIDVKHLTEEMVSFFDKMDNLYGMKRAEYAPNMVFMSHETYTPARGGSANAEVSALTQTFGNSVNQIMVTNTKGYTGHTLGAGIEDAVMVKALQKGAVPPVANLKKIPADFKSLRFSRGEQGNFEYGFHLGAGFGSNFAFLFVRKLNEKTVTNNPEYAAWLSSVTGVANPQTFIKDNMLLADSVPEIVNENGAAVKSAAATAQSVQAAPQAAPAKATVDSAAVMAQIKSIIAEQTGYDVEMLEADLDLEADLGIDTVKQVEIFGKISEHYSIEVPEDLQLSDLNTIHKLADYMAERAGGSVAAAAPSAPASGGADLAEVTGTVKSIIAEQTGYESDMLEADLDLEADLGIDTVKQVEIFGKISEHYSLEVPEDLQLADLNTITKLAGYIAERAGGSAAAAAPSAPAGGGADLGEVTTTVKSIIADQTGYESEMLEADLDLEADLGIDTVKQVEIFGKISENYNLEVPEDLQLADLNTISKLAEYIAERVGASAAPAASASPVAASAPTAGGPSLTEVQKAITDIIAEQTGYEAEMLEADLDLEADLGIDTVKQVEIFGKISESYNMEVPEDLQLADLNTITKLAEYIAQRASGAESSAAETSVPAQSVKAESETAVTSGIKRFSVKVEEKPLNAKSSNVFEGKTYLVVKDSNGFADTFIEKMSEAGGKALTVAEDGADYKVDYSSWETMETSIGAIAESNASVNGIFNFAPVDSFFKDEMSEADINRSIKSQFIFAQKMQSTLDTTGSILAGMSFNSVVFAYSDSENKLASEFAGVSGLYKSLNKEMPNAKVKIIDFDAKEPKRSKKSIIDTFIAEISSEDKEVEIGYKSKKRYGINLVIEDPKQGESLMGEGDRLLVTGGARGITYNILLSLVEKFKTNLVIVGRSDISKVDQKYLSGNPTEKDVIADLKPTMPDAKPVAVKKAAQKMLQLVETVKNIEHLRSLGVEVEYHASDVADYDKLKSIVDSYEKIDGILHAAGVEISQILSKMQDWEFNVVFDTKVKGLSNLIKAFESKEYKYMMTFSSVTARFGNEGQTNYTAANDMIGKMLQREKQLHPERNYKVYDWSAVSGAGMATNETVKKVLESRGLEFIPLEQVVQFFVEDLFFKERIEVLVSGLDYAFDPDGLFPQPGSDSLDRFLDTMTEEREGFKSFARTLTAERDVFLFDHVLDAVPLFLGSTGLETMAEAAYQLAGGKTLTSLRGFQIPYGIKLLKNRPKELGVSAELKGDAIHCEISSVFKNPKGMVMGDPKLHYHADYYFGDASPEKKIEIPEFVPAEVDGGFQEMIYHPKRLFMDGLFRTVEELLSFEENRMIVQIENSSDRDFFGGVKSPVFKTDPVLIDAMFQTGGMLDVMTTEKIILPYKIEEMNFYRQTERHVPYLCITEKTKSEGEFNTYNLTLCDKEGNVYIEIVNFSMIQVNNVEEGMSIKDKIRRK